MSYGNDDDKVGGVKGASGGRQSAIEQARAFSQMLSQRKAEQNTTTTAGSDDDSLAHGKTRGNKDREQSIRATEGFDTNAATGQVGATGISASQQSGNSFSGGQEQDSNSSAHREKTQFSNIATAKSRIHPNQIQFGDISPEDRKLTQLRNRICDQYQQRFGVELNADSRQVLNKMTDADELQAALKVMAQGKRSDIEEPTAFKETVLKARSDSFQVIDQEQIQKQQQGN